MAMGRQKDGQGDLMVSWSEAMITFYSVEACVLASSSRRVIS